MVEAAAGPIPLTERVSALLREDAWVVTPDPEVAGGLHLEPSQGRAPWPLVASVDPVAGRVVLISLLPDDVPAERRGPVLQVLNVANLGLDGGCFDLDPDDGEVRMRTALDLGGAEVDDAQLGALVGAALEANLQSMEQWIEQIAAVADGQPLEGDEAR